MNRDKDRKDMTGYRHCRRRWRGLPHEYIEGNRCPESGFTLPCAPEPTIEETLDRQADILKALAKHSFDASEAP